VVITEHNCISQEAQFTEQVSARLIPFTIKLLYPLADEVIAVSHGVAKELDALIPYRKKATHVIYNAVVTPEIYHLAQAEVEHPWFQDKNLPIVVGAGRFVRQKDFSTLLNAFADLSATIKARLVLLGSGREQDELQSLVSRLGLEDQVWISGFVKNPYAYLSRADVFVLSSQWEGLPTIIIEAIALGIPVVSTDCPSGPSEILQQGKYGRLVPVGDVRAMSQAIADTLQTDNRTIPPDWIAQFTPEVATLKYIKALGLASNSDKTVS
jgi:glycosyltransferase involved in cell wall biosynthesis